MNLEEFIFSHATYLPLFVEGVVPYSGPLFGSGSTNNNLPLYTYGSQTAGDSLMLFVEGGALSCLSSLDLYCHNTGVEGTLTFHTIGAGVNDDYLPVDNTLMLYLKCAFGASLPLYTHGGPQPSSNQSLNLYTIGHVTTVGSLDLVVPNVYGILTSSLNLYTSGF